MNICKEDTLSGITASTHISSPNSHIHTHASSLIHSSYILVRVVDQVLGSTPNLIENYNTHDYNYKSLVLPTERVDYEEEQELMKKVGVRRGSRIRLGEVFILIIIPQSRILFRNTESLSKRRSAFNKLSCW